MHQLSGQSYHLFVYISAAFCHYLGFGKWEHGYGNWPIQPWNCKYCICSTLQVNNWNEACVLLPIIVLKSMIFNSSVSWAFPSKLLLLLLFWKKHYVERSQLDHFPSEHHPTAKCFLLSSLLWSHIRMLFFLILFPCECRLINNVPIFLALQLMKNKHEQGLL